MQIPHRNADRRIVTGVCGPVTSCATPHMLHMQGLRMSPQTVPINPEAADQTCWSAHRAPVLGGGEYTEVSPVEYEDDERRPALLELPSRRHINGHTKPARKGQPTS